jgi:two-component system OmpR family response regulator
MRSQGRNGSKTPVPEPPSRSSRLVRPDGTPVRVVIVDDEPVQRLEMEAIVTEHGGLVLGTTAWGNTAVILAHQQHPDVAILDVVLYGELDGIEVARRLLLTDGDIAILFVTGHSSDRTRKEISALNGPELVYKPVTPDQLVRAIRRKCRLDS